MTGVGVVICLVIIALVVGAITRIFVQGHNKALFVRGCSTLLVLFIVVPIGYFFVRVMVEGKAVERAIANQPPGFWGRVRFPISTSGPVIIGVPVDSSSKKLSAAASKALTASLDKHTDILSNRTLRAWCVPLRLVRLGESTPFDWAHFVLYWRKDGAVEEKLPEKTVNSLTDCPKQYRDALNATHHFNPDAKVVDALLVFLVSRKVSLDYSKIERVSVNVEPYGFDLERRR